MTLVQVAGAEVDSNINLAPAPLHGKDYSYAQGLVDWDKELADGVQFALIRASEGVDIVDSQFAANRAGVVRLGIPHGFYHFCDLSGSAQAQAAFFVATVTANGPLEVGESMWIDQEQAALGDAFWDAILLSLDQLLGFPAGGYASASYFVAHGLTNPDDAGAWDADWSQTAPAPPAGWPFWAIWQNSNSGTCALVGGGTSRCDTDLFNGTAAEFLRYGKPATTPAPVPTPAPTLTPVPAPAPAPPVPSPETYVTVRGDSLWAISARLSPQHNGALYMTLYDCDGNPGKIGPDPGDLAMGLWLELPAGWGTPAAAPAPPPPSTTYTVRLGDNLTNIAAAKGVSLTALENANRWILQRSGTFNTIDVGWVLSIP